MCASAAASAAQRPLRGVTGVVVLLTQVLEGLVYLRHELCSTSVCLEELLQAVCYALYTARSQHLLWRNGQALPSS
jgi:hypothetical protein